MTPFLAATMWLQAVASGGSEHQVFHGRNRQTRVTAPRIETAARIDGRLDEPEWTRAALLTGFSNYNPVDAQPADDSTEVLLWYSPTVIYIGVRAFEHHGSVHATLAARDRIESDDFIQLFIDPFNDRRRAIVLAVNPFGVQADGIRVEGSNVPPPRGRTFGFRSGGSYDQTHDFVFESKGRITSFGYEIEVAVPFKSLQYQASSVQTWALQVLRQVQHSGFSQTWTPARRGSASFLAQSGHVVDLTDLESVRVFEVNPAVTSKAHGRGVPDHGWRYGRSSEVGGNARWGFAPSLSLTVAAKPDFSQVESDAAQIPGDVRFALLFAEKRPFFTDGQEHFNVPNSLIYTRRIVQPALAAKLTGKVGRTSVATLAAIDQEDPTDPQGLPRQQLLRVQRDVGSYGTAGIVYAGRNDASMMHRVLAFDMRTVHGGWLAAQVQGAASSTVLPGERSSGALWEGVLDCTRHRWGCFLGLTGIHPDFEAQMGFVPRTDFVRATAAQRVSWFPATGALERLLMRLQVQGIWKYRDFFDRRPIAESKVNLEHIVSFQGGWTLSLTPVKERFVFDSAAYATYHVERQNAAGPDTVPFRVSPPVSSLVLLGSLATPQYARWSAVVATNIGRDVDFLETRPAKRIDVSGEIAMRPTSRARISLAHQHSTFRRMDGSTLSSANVPRGKLEYQLSRSVALRFVSQYDARERDALRYWAGPGRLLTDSGSAIVAADREQLTDIRLDWLLSYQPYPGTVAFVGYGSSMTEDDQFRFRHLRRTADGFFMKLSYVFRR